MRGLTWIFGWVLSVITNILIRRRKRALGHRRKKARQPPHQRERERFGDAVRPALKKNEGPMSQEV